MAGVTLTTLSNILKQDYQGPIREQLNQSNVLTSVLKKDVSRTAFRGKEAIIPVHTGRNVGRAFADEGSTLPAAGNQAFAQATYNMTYLYGRIQLTGQTIAASSQDKGSFARALDTEMRGLQKDLSQTVNRCLWSDGSGRLTDVTSVGVGATNTTDQAVITVLSTRFLEVGMPVFIAKRDGTKLADKDITVKSIDSATTFTLSANLAFAVTTGDEDYSVFLEGSRVGPSGTEKDADISAATSDWGKPLQMWGLDALINDTDPTHALDATRGWGGGLGLSDSEALNGNTAGLPGQIIRGSNSYWKANVVTPDAATTTTFDDLQSAYDESEIEGEAVPGIVLTSHLIRRKLAGLMTALRQIGTEQELAAGWTGFKFNNSVVIADRHAHRAGNPTVETALPTTNVTVTNMTTFRDIYLLPQSALEFQILEELAWEDTGGVVVRSGVGTGAVDTYEAFMKAYWNLIITRPNACSRVSGVRL